MISRLRQRKDDTSLSRQSAAEGHRPYTALQVGYPLFEHRHRRIHNARVDVAVFLQIEVGRGRLSIFKDKCRGLVDGWSAGAGVVVGMVPGMDSASLESEGMRSGCIIRIR